MANRAFYRSSRVETTVALTLQAIGHTGSQPGWRATAPDGAQTDPAAAAAVALVADPGRVVQPSSRAADRHSYEGRTRKTEREPSGEAEPAMGHVRSERTREPHCGQRPRTESELLHDVLEGDSSGWQEFEQRYSRLIQSCIRRAIAPFPAISPDDTREIQAMLWVQLLANDRRKLRGFEPKRGCALSTWIGMLSIHCAYDYLRALRREPVRVALADAERLSSELPDPSDQCARREHADKLRAALECFSARDREFVRLYFGEGLEAEQVAGQMGISVKTVYSKKHKIRTRLESAMAERRLAA